MAISAVTSHDLAATLTAIGGYQKLPVLYGDPTQKRRDQRR
jgi:hypothetical protein